MRTITRITLLPLTAPAFAQRSFSADRLKPAAVPIRQGGVFHAATGAWTRQATPSPSLGADVIYNNSCDLPLFAGFEGDTFVTNGREPSPSSPTSLTSRPGCATAYRVNGFEITYCTDQPDPGVLTLDFFSQYGCCASVIGAKPSGSVPLWSLPGSTSGAIACWTVVVDLLAPPQTQDRSFVLLADGDGSWDGGSFFVDSFGWSIRSTLSAAAAQHTGPLGASPVDPDGNPCPYTDWDGTVWDWPIDYAEPGSGMGTCSAIRVEGGPTASGCYILSGPPDPNFHLRLFADACPWDPSASPFCFGDGRGTPCPCGNQGASGAGCANSLGVGATLGSAGVASLSLDTLTLLGAQMPPNAPALYFQGTTRQNGGSGSVFGDGKRCAGGSVVRLGVKPTSGAGTSSLPGPGDGPISALAQIASPTTRTYQVWYRNSAPFCTSATFNLSNGLEVLWGP